MNKTIVLCFLLSTSLSVVNAEKTTSETRERLENEQFAKTKTTSGLTREQIAQGQSEWYSKTPLTEYNGNSDLGTSRYDDEITSAEQIRDLKKNREELKAKSDAMIGRNVFFFSLFLLIGIFLIVALKNKK